MASEGVTDDQISFKVVALFDFSILMPPLSFSISISSESSGSGSSFFDDVETTPIFSPQLEQNLGLLTS